MSKALVYYNSKCLSCGNCEEVMVKVGPMVFCNDCFKKELVDKGMNIDENGDVAFFSKIYKIWIKKYKELPT
jgi:hypothetical protein